MIETVICICGLVAFGGIANLSCSEAKYSDEYYHYLGSKKQRKPYLPAEIELYRYF